MNKNTVLAISFCILISILTVLRFIIKDINGMGLLVRILWWFLGIVAIIFSILRLAKNESKRKQ